MLAALASCFLLAGIQFPSGPVEFGRAELMTALREKGIAQTPVTMVKWNTGDVHAETYTLNFKPGKIQLSFDDENGAMYGLLEAAERIRNSGKDAWKQPVVTGKPYLIDRGWNIFLPLPWDYDKNFVDNDPAALTDPKRWFFMDDDYWRTLFDQMARARLNWLDIHGPYDLDTTRFPNLYAYFIQSEKFPKVGVAPEIKARLLRQLNHVIDLAHARGIRVSLMSYEARFDIPHNPRPGYQGTEQEVYDYTKEVVEKMVRQCPKLDKIGYRIGESGRGAEFFKCYTEAIAASGRDIPVYTRSWVTTKARVVPLAKASNDFTVEIKYNGEQWGAPYIMQGGRTAGWYSYFWEDYLSYSGADGAKKMWPGVECSELAPVGSHDPSANSKRPPVAALQRWPSQPYKIVWQVRANGTHRIFPFFQPDLTRTSILSMKVGTTTGYTIESMASYFPQEPRYYLKPVFVEGEKKTGLGLRRLVAALPGGDGSPHPRLDDGAPTIRLDISGDKPPQSKLGYKWIHQRDEMYMAGWGRLGYDPEVPDWKFEAMLARKFGKEVGSALAYFWTFASRAIPDSYLGYSLGPDHRNHAPELEWGGDTEAFIQGEPFDSHVYRNVREDLAYHSTGGFDGRRTVGREVRFSEEPEPASVPRYLSLMSHQSDPRLAEYVAAVRNLNYLNSYYRFRQLAALKFAEWEAGEEAARVESGGAMDRAGHAYELLTASTGELYRPFTDRLRMHTHTFSWQTELAKVQAEEKRLLDVLGLAGPPMLRPLPRFDRVIQTPTFSVTCDDDTVTCSVQGSTVKRAWALVKPLPSSTYFHRIPMELGSEGWRLAFPREPWGHAVSFEIDANGYVARFPSASRGQPYLTVPSLEKPTPFIYSAEEAMRYLDPTHLDPARYGWMIVGTRAWAFHNGFDNPTKRKVLTAVEQGMNLLVMQQDYTSGRYPLDWLPAKPKIVNRPETVFDPAGALGMERVETKEILWQPFDKADGWEVFGNGGVARMKYGKGEIWMVQGRFLQRMHIPGVARNLKRLLEAASPANAGTPRVRKPAILIDTGTEGASYVTSVIPDFMNAHDLPFLTLGEAIAKEQGMDSTTAVPGPTFDDDLLGGKGKEIANRFLKGEVQRASKRPTPATVEAFEKERKLRKAELLRSLGLDPMPPKTPLNAKVTGEIPRKGYKIQKIVYESRPRFYVTAHLYLPDPLPAGKLPVVVHVNGHWAHKKDEDRIQLRAAFCAVRGYAALAIDSPGHSFEGNSLIERRAEGDHNDWFLALATNATGYYVWDVIRGLDYLETRPEIDMAKIGLTGASGGGLATLYAFAAEDRFAAAIPVVYMSSMELAPDNGCLCNHVPATCQIGDRSDVIAIQAPKPVYIFGAEVDGEFPPDAMRLTGKKMVETWSLFGKGDDAKTRIYPGGHDYSQPMREAMIGFFDKTLRGVGDGSPVAQPPLEAIDPEDRILLAADPPMANEQTMRDLTLEYLANAPKEASAERALAVNGGRPKIEPKNYKISPLGPKMTVTFEAEPGLVTPAIFLPGADLTKPVTLIVSDQGKAASIVKDKGTRNDSRVYLDILGTGELNGFELRYPIYLGRSPAFIGGIQIAAAAKLLRQNGHGGQIQIEARGPLASMAAMWAGLMEPGLFAKITGSDALKSWEEAMEPGRSPYLVQPRAHLIGSLPSLQGKVPASTWESGAP